MKQDHLYFQHDYHARDDGKLLKIRAKFGNESGAGLFWFLVEIMAEDESGSFDNQAIDELSLMLGITQERIRAFIDYALEIHLFIKDGDRITSARMQEHKEWRRSQSESGKRGAKARWKNDGKDSEPIATAMTSPKATAMHSIVQDRTVQNKTEQSSRAREGLVKETLQTEKPGYDGFKRDSDEERVRLDRDFAMIAEAEQWCDGHYAKKTVDQITLLRGERRDECYRKMRVMLNAFRSNSLATKKISKKMFHEIAGYVNDFGAMERQIDGKEIARRRDFAKEEGDIDEF